MKSLQNLSCLAHIDNYHANKMEDIVFGAVLFTMFIMAGVSSGSAYVEFLLVYSAIITIIFTTVTLITG
jgi:hypothetical protein